MRNFYLFICATFLFGCASKEIKDFDAESLLPKDSSFTLAADSNFTNQPIPFFQELFPDQALNYLIRNGLEKNPDWKAQLAKLEVVKVGSGINLSESKPALSARLGWMEGEEKTRESNFQKGSVPNLQAGSLFNWEIDLWGKWKLMKKSSLLHIEEAEHLKDAAKMSFIHKIAEIWFLIIAKQEQIEIFQTAISSQLKTLQFYKERIDAGLDDNITFARQSVVHDQLKLEKAKFSRELEVYKISLSSMIGQPLNGQLPEIPSLSEIKLPKLPTIFPTEALKQRPDLKAKEAKLRESIYVEKSSEYDLYPSLGLQMSGISMSSNISEPFEQWKASFGPVLQFPIWSPKKKILLETARTETAVKKEEWKAIIYLAIEEIESCTRSFVMGNNEYVIAKKSSEETRRILGITKERFRAGLVSELVLLEDERQFLKTNISELESRLQIFQFALDLSKSLGLEWREFN